MRCRVISLAAAAALALSCSVKEDRTLCPCLLVLDLSSCTNAPDNVRIDLKTMEGRIRQDIIPGQDKPFYEFPVAKGVCSLSAFLCPRELSFKEDRITVVPGENFPELYACNSVFEASGETSAQKVVLHKQFAVVTLDFEESPWDPTICEIKVKGGINGIYLSDLNPIEGPFIYEVPANEQGIRTFRLPRQTETSAMNLIIEIKSPGGSPQIFDLGKYLYDAGYDWEMEDLQDIVVKIRESEISVEISSSDWIIQFDDVIVI